MVIFDRKSHVEECPACHILTLKKQKQIATIPVATKKKKHVTMERQGVKRGIPTEPVQKTARILL